MSLTFKALCAQLDRIRSRAAARRAMERATPTPYGTFYSVPKDRGYDCPNCGAGCTLEAMQQCNTPGECPTIKYLKLKIIVDRRPSDRDPNFPSIFTYSNEPEARLLDQQLQLEQLRLELAEEKRLAPGYQGTDD